MELIKATDVNPVSAFSHQYNTVSMIIPLDITTEIPRATATTSATPKHVAGAINKGIHGTFFSETADNSDHDPHDHEEGTQLAEPPPAGGDAGDSKV